MHAIVMLLGTSIESILHDLTATLGINEAEVHILMREDDREEGDFTAARYWRFDEIDDMLEAAALDTEELHIVTSGGTPQQLVPLTLKLAELTGIELHIYDISRSGVFKYDPDDETWDRID